MCGYGCRCVYKRTRNLYTDIWTLDSRIEGNLYSLFYAFLPFSNSLQGHYYFFKTEEKYGGYFFLKRNKSKMWCNLSPRPGQKLISVPSPTSDHLPLFELLCWQGAHGSGCAGLAWSKEAGESDLEVILMWFSPAHRAGKQSRVLGQ